MRGEKSNFRCRLQFSCFINQRLDEGEVKKIFPCFFMQIATRGWLRRVKQTREQIKLTLLIFAVTMRLAEESKAYSGTDKICPGYLCEG
jgi:hypothetical protein